MKKVYGQMVVHNKNSPTKDEYRMDVVELPSITPTSLSLVLRSEYAEEHPYSAHCDLFSERANGTYRGRTKVEYDNHPPLESTIVLSRTSGKENEFFGTWHDDPDDEEYKAHLIIYEGNDKYSRKEFPVTTNDHSIISNISGSHKGAFSELLNSDCSDVIWVSPFITEDFSALLGDLTFKHIKAMTLVTTLKPSNQDQITKPRSLQSFYDFCDLMLPGVDVAIHISNSLHGKLYIFKGVTTSTIVTSANLTASGLLNNAEWGLMTRSVELTNQLEEEVFQSIDYFDVTRAQVKKLQLWSDQYQRDNPDWGKASIPKCDVMNDVYNQLDKEERPPRYYLKPIGVSDDPVLKEDMQDFSAIHQDLAFSKKGTGAIKAGDIVITTAVGSGCLLAYFKVTGSPVEATRDDIKQYPWKERWPWHIEGRNQSVEYGGSWWKYDLDRKQLCEEFVRLKPGCPVTRAGGRTVNAINFGADKLEITKEFAEFLIQKIENRG